MNVILVEDDPECASYLLACMQAEGHRVTHFAEPVAFFRATAELRAEALVVDWHLPSMSGRQVLGRVRELYAHSLPVLVITGDRSEHVALTALGLDADDFVYKPITGSVFRARLAAVLRRQGRDRAVQSCVEVPPYLLDRRSQRLQRGGQLIELTPRQFDLAWMLFTNLERLLTRDQLLAGVWGLRGDINTHTLAQHVYALRRKLDLVSFGFSLNSVYGSGYRLVPPGSAAGDGEVGR